MRRGADRCGRVRIDESCCRRTWATIRIVCARTRINAYASAIEVCTGRAAHRAGLSTIRTTTGRAYDGMGRALVFWPSRIYRCFSSPS